MVQFSNLEFEKYVPAEEAWRNEQAELDESPTFVKEISPFGSSYCNNDKFIIYPNFE